MRAGDILNIGGEEYEVIIFENNKGEEVYGIQIGDKQYEILPENRKRAVPIVTGNRETIIKTMKNYIKSKHGKYFSERDVGYAYDAFVESVKAIVFKYGKVKIRDFFTLEATTLPRRTGYDVTRNAYVVFPERQVLKVTISQAYKDAIEFECDTKFVKKGAK